MDRNRTRPNVVLVTTHDLGQRLGCYGVETVDTPNVDELAADGVQFEDAYATTPVFRPPAGVCSPGATPSRRGSWGSHTGRGGRSTTPNCFPEHLDEAGYETHLCGFQHVADPDRLGFQHTHSENVDAEETTAAAADVFETAGEGPFYAQVGFTEVHRSFDQGRTVDYPVDAHPQTFADHEERMPTTRSSRGGSACPITRWPSNTC